jgi:hypothetical protein
LKEKKEKVMSLRLLAGSLLLGSFALIAGFMPSQSIQTPEKPLARSKWEYKALKLDANQCAFENQITTSLNSVGDEGWELVGYERLSAAFPQSAEGTLLMQPAATGVGRQNNPPTADSFQGAISMKMPPVQPGACRFMFKRMVPAPANR